MCHYGAYELHGVCMCDTMGYVYVILTRLSLVSVCYTHEGWGQFMMTNLSISSGFVSATRLQGEIPLSLFVSIPLSLTLSPSQLYFAVSMLI